MSKRKEVRNKWKKWVKSSRIKKRRKNKWPIIDVHKSCLTNNLWVFENQTHFDQIISIIYF